MTPNQLFIISEDAWKSLSVEAVESTVSALKELGLYALPYPSVDIAIEADLVCAYYHNDERRNDEDFINGKPKDRHYLGPEVIAFCRNSTTEFPGDLTLECAGSFRWKRFCIALNGKLNQKELDLAGVTEEEMAETFGPESNFAASIRDSLITLLATKNAVKETKENKLHSLGIGKKKPFGRYRYTTTISVPSELEEDEDHPGVGGVRCPHLRRGHIRRQHYGPKNSLIKSIWIEPVFVNADKDFVSTRVAYNLSAPAGITPQSGG